MVAGRAVTAALLAAVLLGACGEPAQVVVHLETDAPLEGLGPGWFALFDRLRLDLYPPGTDEACAGCARQVSITEDDRLARRLSFGVTPRPGSAGYRVRARLFKAVPGRQEGPTPDLTIDFYASLPVVGAHERKDLTLELPTARVARPIGGFPGSPAEGVPGPPAGEVPPPWPGARRVECSGAAQPGEVCVPGGAYWMGDSLGAVSVVGAPLHQRLVVVRPYFLDAHEVTVGELRASGLAQDRRPGSEPNPRRRSRGGGASLTDWCTYTGSDEGGDALPVNCVSWQLARELCLARGADLPTEAQWEFAAGGLRAASFPWGEERPACADAVLRASSVAFNELGKRSYETSCLRPASIGGPLPAGEPGRDRDHLDLAGRIVDLAGNLSELMLDTRDGDGRACWGSGIVGDQACDADTSPGKRDRSVRGGAWHGPATPAASDFLSTATLDSVTPTTGFRCARRDAP